MIASTAGSDLSPGWERFEAIDDIDSYTLDTLPYGAIRLATDGTIERYSAVEAGISGLRPQDLIRRTFFTDVAPCTNLRAFAGRFFESLAKRELNAVFPYHLNFHGAPIDVWVQLFYSRTTGAVWVFVPRRQAVA